MRQYLFKPSFPKSIINR